MSLPKFDGFAFPVLSVLGGEPKGLSKAMLYDRVAAHLKIDPDALNEQIASGQSVFENRVGWACSWMKACGWVQNPKRAWWVITDAGRKRLATGVPITAAEMRPTANAKSPDTTKPALAAADIPTAKTMPSPAPVEDPAALTPDERIATAVAEILADVESRVLDRLAAATPKFFEQAVLRLLATMNYTGEFGASEHSGKTADGGIDGILYLDRLHLERVYVQAKRWKEAVGASVVRDFAGAMDAEAATKGVILTTAGFTKEARKYIEKSPKAIRLVDGPEIARLMVEFGVGVSRAQTIVLPKLDEDFFEGT